MNQPLMFLQKTSNGLENFLVRIIIYPKNTNTDNVQRSTAKKFLLVKYLFIYVILIISYALNNRKLIRITL